VVKGEGRGIDVNWLYVVKGEGRYRCKLAVCGKRRREVSV
jgi:hypothetical protein